MEQYIPEEYKEIIGKLEPFIEECNLDKISIESLVRASVEIEKQPIQPAAYLWKSKDGKCYTTKASNKKVNLKFALSTAFRLKTIISQEDIWLVLAILHLIVDMFTNATKMVDELSALTLLSIYRIQHGDLDRIYSYAKEICPADKIEMVKKEDMEISLFHLEELGCIMLEQGEYLLNETVTSSMIKGIK